MEKRGDVVRLKERETDARGRPKAIYLYVGAIPLTRFMQVLDTAEAEQKKAPEDIQRGVIYKIATGTMFDPEFDEEKRREYFAKAAKAMKDEDPRDLLYRFAVWLFEQHDKAVEKFRDSAEGRRAGKELEESERTIESIERLVRVIFNRNLGIPDTKEYTDGRRERGSICLRFNKRTREVERSSFDYENTIKIKQYLEFAVIGEKVLEKESAVPLGREYSEAGTDASIHKFDLSLLPTEFEKNRMAITTAAALRLNFYDPRPPQIDASPEPKQWRYYTEEDAVDKGLIIPPDAYLMLDDIIWERVTSACMNLRQYIKDGECFEVDKYGRISDILFRDGRIFPLEHLFDDYCQAGVHGRVVIKSIEAFRNLVNRVSASFPRLPRPTYCGVVKRPEVAILSPLVFWYMKYGSKPPIWPTMDDRKFILRIPMSDQRVAHYFFEALASELGQNERWVTCRFVRLFVSMNERIAMSTARTYEEWLSFLQHYIEKHRFPANPDVEPYAELCARAAVSSCFISLPKTSNMHRGYLTPRYEFLLPSQVVETRDPKQIRDYDQQLVQAVVNALADPKGLDVYPESVAESSDEHDRSSPPEPVFIFPKATVLAHIYAKEAGAVYRRDFLGYLWKIIIEAVKTGRKRFQFT